MDLAKRIILWGLAVAAVILVAVNYQTIKDKVVGFNQNAAYVREAREAGSKYMTDIVSNWSYDALLPVLDDSVRAEWQTPEKSNLFSTWNGSYGSITSKRVSVSMKQDKGEQVDFVYRAEMQCAYKNALLLMTLRRKAENDWKIVDLQVSDLPADAAKFE